MRFPSLTSLEERQATQLEDVIRDAMADHIGAEGQLSALICLAALDNIRHDLTEAMIQHSPTMQKYKVVGWTPKK